MTVFSYVALFQWMYEHYLYPAWDYFGFHYNPPPMMYLVLAWILSVTPSFWMPIRLTRPSQLAYWVLYITVFIPSMFVPFYAGLNTPGEISMLVVTLYAGFAIVGVCYELPLARLGWLRVPNKTFWTAFVSVTVVLSLWMIVFFRNSLQFLSFNDVYGLRDATTDLSEGSLVNSAFMLMTGAINPFLMGWGLYHRRKWVFLAGALGQLLVYSIGGTKGSILSIVFVSGFYYLFKLGRIPFALKVMFGTLALVGGLCLSYVLADYQPVPLQFHSVLLFVILMRTMSINGLMTAWYYDFFQHNPNTLFSHLKVLDLFFKYPYANRIGLEIGFSFSGNSELDATAHFWAADGIAGLGLPGILLVSVVCAFVFWVLDSAAARHDPKLVGLIVCYAAINLSNISMFTTLLSGGLGLLILLIYTMPIGVVDGLRTRRRGNETQKICAMPFLALVSE